jgi:hypothetical protein
VGTRIAVYLRAIEAATSLWPPTTRSMAIAPQPAGSLWLPVDTGHPHSSLSRGSFLRNPKLFACRFEVEDLSIGPEHEMDPASVRP